jgi:hypothetical protein
MSAEVDGRPVYATKQLRAADLRKEDVTRNGFGKWDVVTAVEPTKSGPNTYVDITFETGKALTLRTVQLVPIQVVRPS